MLLKGKEFPALTGNQTFGVASNAINAYNDSVATLTIRNLSDRAHDALRLRAAGNRRSMEAEARLLIEGLDAPEATASHLDAIRALQAHAIAAAGGPEKAKGIVDSFLAERAGEWDEG